jgi:hypothetical protein
MLIGAEEMPLIDPAIIAALRATQTAVAASAMANAERAVTASCAHGR